MSYLTQDAIANDPNMLARVAQCAAQEKASWAPDTWAFEQRRVWSSAPGWDAAWEYALNTHPDDPQYQPGEDEAVITDEMILSQVQSMIPPPPPPEETVVPQ